MNLSIYQELRRPTPPVRLFQAWLPSEKQRIAFGTSGRPRPPRTPVTRTSPFRRPQRLFAQGTSLIQPSPWGSTCPSNGQVARLLPFDASAGKMPYSRPMEHPAPILTARPIRPWLTENARICSRLNESI